MNKKLLTLLFVATAVFGHAFAAEIPLEEVAIHLHRSVCLGECPVYSISIYGSGVVAYEGVSCVAQQGPAETEVTTEEVIELVNRFLTANFFNAKSRYEYKELVRRGQSGGLQLLRQEVHDLSAITLRLQLGEREHTVYLYYNAPAELTELARAVDELANSRQWVIGEKEEDQSN